MRGLGASRLMEKDEFEEFWEMTDSVLCYRTPPLDDPEAAPQTATAVLPVSAVPAAFLPARGVKVSPTPRRPEPGVTFRQGSVRQTKDNRNRKHRPPSDKCGECINCLSMPRFGGDGRRKKRCSRVRSAQNWDEATRSGPTRRYEVAFAMLLQVATDFRAPGGTPAPAPQVPAPVATPAPAPEEPDGYKTDLVHSDGPEEPDGYNTELVHSDGPA